MAVDAMGEKAAELIPISILLHIGHVFIHEKRYVGFCTPRCTVMDAKKEKKRKS